MFLVNNTMASEYMSRRNIDSNGYLTVEKNPITKAGVFEYLGSEIGAPEPTRIYKVYRPMEEIEKAAESAKLMPFIDEHAWLGAQGEAPEKKGIQGVIGEQIEVSPPYLLANLKIHSQFAQNLIKDNDKVALSAGYKCDWEPGAGEYEGQPYEYTQRNLVFNHLALVDKGRSGSDVKVNDHCFTIALDSAELLPMTIEEILAALAELSDEDKAKLLAALNPVADDDDKAKDDDDKKPVDESAAASAAEEADQAAEIVLEAAEAAAEAAAEGDPTKVEEAEEAIAEAEEKLEEVKEDLDKAAMDKAIRRTKRARVALDTAKKLMAVKSTAMDEASVVKMMTKRDSLVKALTAHMGVFDHDGLTVGQIAEKGCKHFGLNVSKDQQLVALDAALKVAVPDSAKPALDSAPVKQDVAALYGGK